ncbi:MAG: class I SAM-dependent methyltransferase [Magnetococcales bacterium]|nr:class I SAM-dependent methyltransferase [Magnetococcales bacterium]MBF0116818.1 class I SAM-dependent methyltransferase [Magnetococcales bacterium]
MDKVLDQEKNLASVALWDASGRRQAEALALAQRLALPLCGGVEEAREAALLLVLTADRLELQSRDGCDGGAIAVDFVTGKAGYRRQHGGGWRQPLARAVGLRPQQGIWIVDATPGLGQDAFVLAALGGRVTMLERAPVLALLLEDGLRRLQAESQLRGLPQVTLTVQMVDSRHWLAERVGLPGAEQPAVIYLDPMYPHREGSALVKKEMRRVRRLVGDDTDAGELLAVALQVAQRRVVVKRPRAAPHLGERKPTMVLESEQTRYDVYRLG